MMLNRRAFIGYTAAAGVVAATALAGCADGSTSAASSKSQEGGAVTSAPASASGQVSGPTSAASAATQMPKLGKSVVVFFSRANENYEVGYVDEGNTAKVARSIAGKVVSDVFEIVPMQEYPESYEACVAIAKKEQADHARPELLDDFAGFDEYDTVYLGYPIWHSDLPMVVYAFVESHDWQNKKVMPFCTHGDSGLNGTDSKLKSLCAGATVSEGLAIKGSVAQEASTSMDSAINAWLAKVRV